MKIAIRFDVCVLRFAETHREIERERGGENPRAELSFLDRV